MRDFASIVGAGRRLFAAAAHGACAVRPHQRGAVEAVDMALLALLKLSHRLFAPVASHVRPDNSCAHDILPQQCKTRIKLGRALFIREAFFDRRIAAAASTTQIEITMLVTAASAQQLKSCFNSVIGLPRLAICFSMCAFVGDNASILST